MNKILNNEQKAAEFLFDHLKENHFESKKYDIMLFKGQYMLTGEVFLCYDPSKPTLTEIDIPFIGFFDRHEDSELALDYETFVEAVKSMIYEYSIQ